MGKYCPRISPLPRNFEPDMHLQWSCSVRGDNQDQTSLSISLTWALVGSIALAGIAEDLSAAHLIKKRVILGTGEEFWLGQFQRLLIGLNFSPFLYYLT